MKGTIKIFSTILFIILGLSAFSQDPQFSQFYASPLYLSPSLAGATDGSRAVLNFRDQWPEIPGAFITAAVSYDHNFNNINSGVGFLFTRDQAGSGNLKTTDIAFVYAYTVRLNRRWEVKPAIKFSYSQRGLDFYSLTFVDQVSLGGTATSSVEPPTLEKTGYFDMGASVLAYTHKHWFGATFDHLAKPNESLLGATSIVPKKYTFYGGTKIGLNGKIGYYNEESLSLALLYKAQGKYDQLDVGVYWLKTPLVLGIWYRGIPLLKSYQAGYMNNDALILLAGYRFKDVQLGYSYDFTISRLISSTGGAHEISIMYEFLQDKRLKKKRRKVMVPCPKF